MGFVALFFITLSMLSLRRRLALVHYRSQELEAMNHDGNSEKTSFYAPVPHVISNASNSDDDSRSEYNSNNSEILQHKASDRNSNPENNLTLSLSDNSKTNENGERADSEDHQGGVELKGDRKEGDSDFFSQSKGTSVEKKSVHALTNSDVASKDGVDDAGKEEDLGVFPDISPIGLKQVDEEPVSFEEPPERIELYTRDDFKAGMRPLCRISHPYVLSNGTILFPKWMERYNRLLMRCAVGRHGFYSSDEVPTFLKQVNNVDGDFALTIRFERFQEPTQDEAIYLTEHVLKASYLFDVFGGDAQQVHAVKEEHCYTYESDSNCTMSRPPRTGLKPAIFVPNRIMQGSQQMRSFKMVEMLGIAHGHGQGVLPLNTSSLLAANHAGRMDNLIGTRFRSVLSADGMFRHLPVEGLKNGNFFSTKNGVVKEAKSFVNEGNCAFTVGIAKTNDETGIKNVEELQGKLKVLTKFALPQASVSVVLLDVRSISLDDHIKQMSDVDIFLAGSGPDLNSMGFMRTSGMVFELMPFGLHSNTHESLARALGLSYERVKSRPQTEVFKQCIESEIFNLRKTGKIKYTEKPEWYDPLMKAWDAAVAEYALKGSSDLDLLSASTPVRNFHSRVCAQRQAIDVSLDDTARQVILASKSKCGGT